MKRASVIIPCYNHAKYVPEAIECSLAQTITGGVEVIVVDDGSTDDTHKVCATYGDKIRYVRQPNRGLASARNLGISLAQGEFLQFLDADDRILPEKIEEQVESLDNEQEAGAAYSDGFLINAVGDRIGPANINHPSGWVFHEFLGMWGTQVAAVLVRKRCLESVGYFNSDTAIRGCEDLDMWLRLALQYRFISLPQKRFEYRVGHGSMSNNIVMMLESGLEVLSRHSAHHGNCADCRVWLRRGRRRWKNNAAYALMSQVREHVHSGNLQPALVKLRQVVQHHPLHLLHSVKPRYLGSKVNGIAKAAVKRLP